jgi:hypothetical protein
MLAALSTAQFSVTFRTGFFGTSTAAARGMIAQGIQPPCNETPWIVGVCSTRVADVRQWRCGAHRWRHLQSESNVVDCDVVVEENYIGYFKVKFKAVGASVLAVTIEFWKSQNMISAGTGNVFSPSPTASDNIIEPGTHSNAPSEIHSESWLSRLSISRKGNGIKPGVRIPCNSKLTFVS